MIAAPAPAPAPAPRSADPTGVRTGAHAVAPQGRPAAALLADADALDRNAGTQAGTTAERARPTEQEQRDAECLTFFVCLVTAALTMLGLAVLTDVEGVPRLGLTLAVTLLVGVTVHAIARPADED